MDRPGFARPSPPSVSPDVLARILDLADDAIISVDEEQRIVLFNRGAEKIFGYSFEEVRGESLDILLPQALAKIHRKDIQHFGASPEAARRMGERRDIMGRRRDGTEFPAEASISRVDVGGRVVFTAILRDITGRVLAEETIRRSLREKEALLREIHHRVKNNLQVVSSLLGLQSRGVSDALTRRMFEESQNRIHSMALLHECLYESGDFSRIDFPEYIRQLTGHLFRSYGVAEDQIRFQTDLGPVRLGPDAAVACGLIINELITNSLKHAFTDGQPGEIRITLYEDSAGTATLVVSDNGQGLPPGLNPRQTRSLGLRLVRTLCQQVGATVDVRSNGGTEFQLRFPNGGGVAHN